MYLREKLDEKELIRNKIIELQHSLLVGFDITENDKVVKVLLEYIDILQNINLIINKVNQQAMLNVGENKISIFTAIEIRKAIKAKIDVITSLIADNNKGLDILVLIDQRDALIVEHNGIDSVIRITDWSVLID